MCVCVCVRERERKREGEGENENEREKIERKGAGEKGERRRRVCAHALRRETFGPTVCHTQNCSVVDHECASS